MNQKIIYYLDNRGITSSTAQFFNLDFINGKIVIPIYDIKNNFLFNKYRRNPESEEGPKYTYDKGSIVALYGIETICEHDTIIICEGELDALALRSKGFCAVTSTGGAQSFQKEWVVNFLGKDVYVCMDNDKAGNEGKLKILEMIPWAKNLPLPKEVGDHGDITDYFVKLKKTPEDLKKIMAVAQPIPIKEEPKPKRKKTRTFNDLEDAKNTPLENFLPFKNDFAHCPFHIDKTASLHRYGKNLDKWKCFSCGEQGDVIDLIMKLHGVGLRDAISIILK